MVKKCIFETKVRYDEFQNTLIMILRLKISLVRGGFLAFSAYLLNISLQKSEICKTSFYLFFVIR